MPELDTLRDWFDFNAQARAGYLETFAKLSPEELTRDRGASYPTLVGIFRHTVNTYRFWLGKAGFTDPEFRPSEPGSDPSLNELRRFESEVQHHVDRFLRSLTEADLDRAFPMPGGGNGGTETLTIRTMLWHLVEEELQHRGELNALLWQIDVDPPIFDWIDWVKLAERPVPQKQ